MDSEQRGCESGRGHGHCRGRGRGLPMPSPVIARGPTARGMRFAGPITLEEIRGARSDVLVPVPTPDASTVTGGRGRGREIQAPVATVSTEASGPTDEGIQPPVIGAPRDTDNAERDPGVPVRVPDVPAASEREGGGRIHKPLPNISMETWDPTDERVQATVCSAPRETGGAVSCSEMEKVSSSPIGSTPLVARGPAGRGKRLTIPSTSSELDSAPTPGRVEKEETSKIVEKELNTVQEMFDYKFKTTRKGKSEKHIMCENWAYAKGINKTIMVISMNEYVNSDENYIPGEIAITPFTLKYGIDLMYTYWTRVDPGDNIPLEHQVDASDNMTKFDLLKPGNPRQGGYRDYARIAEEIEIIIRKNSTPAFFGERDESGDVYFLFCKKEMVDRYTKGLDWLFALGGKEKFPFKLLPLESILVVLSLGGLELEATRRGSVLDCFQEVMEAFTDAVSLVQDTTATSTEELMQTAHDLMKKFTGFTELKYVQKFISLGGKSKRLACQRLQQHPHAFLGAFMVEDQATQYLDTEDYLNQKYLACSYHEDSDKMKTCAKLQVARMIYLALDALMVNYGDGNHGIRAREGKHFPLVRDY